MPDCTCSSTGSDQEKTFGPTISGLIKDNIEPERYILWDSRKRGGRPDTRKLLIDTYKSFNAEGMLAYAPIHPTMFLIERMTQSCSLLPITLGTQK